MSTRGFVGIGNESEWSGRYNHSDSYPTWLGKEVWHFATEAIRKDGDLKQFADTLLGFTDWRQMETGGICEYCGKKTGQAHTIQGDIATKAWNRKEGDPYPDPDALFHQHDDREPNSDGVNITQETDDWLFLEWGYVIDPKTNMMHIFKGCIQTPILFNRVFIRDNGKRDTYQESRYTVAPICSVSLLGSEPDWEQIDSNALDIAQVLEATFSKNPKHPMLDRVRLLPKKEVIDQRIKPHDIQAV